MSSARNHAKRSHRSEHFKRSAFNTYAHKMYVSQATKPKRMTLFGKLAQMLRRKKSEA